MHAEPVGLHGAQVGNLCTRTFNLLNSSGFFTYHQVYHSTILHGARFALSVLYGYQNRQRLLLYTALSWLVFITVVESVYSAVRTDSLYKTDYVYSLKGQTFASECIQNNLSVQLAADLVVNLCRYQLHSSSFRGDIPL